LKLHALINVYNDRTFLAATLESIREVVDQVIVADGAYELYYERYKEFVPDAEPFSTDGSLEIIKHFKGLPQTLYLHPAEGREKPWQNQAVKRTALIDAVPLGDWLLIIDADEMVMGDFQESMEATYESGCIVANCPLYNPGTHAERMVKAWHPRIFQKQEGMHYRGTHWHLRDKFERLIEEKYPIYWTDHFAIVHFKPFKDQSRLIPHHNYMVDLMNRGWLEPKDMGEVLSTLKKLSGGEPNGKPPIN
jgi:hypothetical protein